MRTFVDTSVWISYFRGRAPIIKRELERLIDEDAIALAVPVRVELLSGARKRDRTKLTTLLAAIPTYFPVSTIWTTVEAWTMDSADQGHHFGFGDLLVAAIAAANRGTVWSLDGDFDRLAKLGFISLHQISR